VASAAVAIRSAGAADVEAVAALDREAATGRERLADLQAALVEDRLLVAEREGEIVGYAIHGRFFEFDFIELLVVRPRYRRTGVATALVAGIESRSRTGKLFTSTNRSNIAMQRLCAHLGYLPSGVVENLDDGDPELFFVKRL
jgi:GNAT superfamily N-acetyltransferase